MTIESVRRQCEIVYVCDTREQRPLPVDPGTSLVRRKLDSGDYAIDGCEELFAVERKSLDDLCASLTAGRDRFERELQRLAEMKRAIILVEASMEDLVLGRARSKVSPAAIIGSLNSVHARFGIPTIWASDRGIASAVCFGWLRKCHKHLVEQVAA